VEELHCEIPHIPFLEFIYSVYFSFQPTSPHINGDEFSYNVKDQVLYPYTY
jgi:hypothetical protein